MAFVEYKGVGSTVNEAKRGLNSIKNRERAGEQIGELSYRVSIGDHEFTEQNTKYHIAFAQALEIAGISAKGYDTETNPPKIEV